MATETIELSRFLPATPDRVYLAWLNGRDHTAMTGSKATVASAEVGGAFTAWDGYIDGVHVALEPGRRIVQAWRSDDFPADAPESYLELLLEPAPGGSQVTLRHRELPAGQGPGVLAGWDEFYFTPMERFFAAETKRRGAKAPAKKAKSSKRKPPARRRSKPVARAGAKKPPREAPKTVRKQAPRSAPRKAAPRKAPRTPARTSARTPAPRSARKSRR
jgi:uncharacterized protein YndB with AHSA1/START domain